MNATCTLEFWATLRSLVSSLSSFSSSISNWPLHTSCHSNSRKTCSTSPCTTHPHCQWCDSGPHLLSPRLCMRKPSQWVSLPLTSAPSNPSFTSLFKILKWVPLAHILAQYPLTPRCSFSPPSLKYRMVLLPRITPLPFSPYSHITDQTNINSSLGLSQLLHSVSSIFLSLVIV